MKIKEIITEKIISRNIYNDAYKAIDDALSNVKYANDFSPKLIKNTNDYKLELKSEFNKLLTPICQKYKNDFTGNISVNAYISNPEFTHVQGEFRQHHDRIKTFSSIIDLSLDLSILGTTYSKFLKFYDNKEKYNNYVHKLSNVFTHEIIHLIQASNIPTPHKDAAFDHSKVPSTIKNFSVQYLGATKEIEAHASMVANDLLRTTSSINDALKLLSDYFKNPRSIPKGSTLSRYWIYLNNKSNPTINAWKTFCKKIYQHIITSNI